MVDTSLDIDLSLLVGAMDEIGCEHSRHHDYPKAHDNGPATHYLRASHGCGHDAVYAACSKWVRTVSNYTGMLRCSGCSAPVEASAIKVLGPVNG